MKKVLSLILILVLLCGIFPLGAAAREAEPLKVAIVQQMDHTSLDEIRTAIEAELTAGAKARGLTLEYKSFNGQNDASMLGQIGAQILHDHYDLIIPIASLAAQSMVSATEGSGIPIVFAAISDPEKAGLSGLPQVTGISDALDTRFILDMALAASPEIRTFGLLYSNSEPNSAAPVAQARAYLESKGIEIIEKTGNTTDEIVTAASALVGRADAVFTPTDNVVMGAASAVEEIFRSAHIPHYTGADSFVTSGALATCGVNYTALGTAAGDLALDVLESGELPPYFVMEDGIITVNAETAAAIGLDYSPFFDMTETVLEVGNPVQDAPAPRKASGSVILSAVELGCIYSLVALALMLSFRVLNIADMTTDGSFTLGCAVSATMAVAGHPILAIPAAMISGAAAGYITAMLQTRMKIPSILAGIITNTGLYTVNLAVMGFSSNVNMMKSTTIFTMLQPILGPAYRILPVALLTLAAGSLLVLFLKTRLGLSVRATGDNPDMVRASSINTAFTITVGLCAANALTALSGAVLAQYQRTADINLGAGMVIIGLASLIIGEAILPRGKLWTKALGAIVGSVVYRMIIALALRLDLPSECLKLISAVIVALAIGLPALRQLHKGGK